MSAIKDIFQLSSIAKPPAGSFSNSTPVNSKPYTRKEIIEGITQFLIYGGIFVFLIFIIYQNCSPQRESFKIDYSDGVIRTTRDELIARGLLAPHSNSRYSAILLRKKRLNKKPKYFQKPGFKTFIGNNKSNREDSPIINKNISYRKYFIESDSTDRMKTILNENNNNPDYVSWEKYRSSPIVYDASFGKMYNYNDYETPVFVNSFGEEVPIDFPRLSNVFQEYQY